MLHHSRTRADTNREFNRQRALGGGYEYEMTCHECRGHEPRTTSTRPLDDRAVKLELQRLGWVVGRSRLTDLCPRCAAAHHMASSFRVRNVRTGETVQPFGIPAPRSKRVDTDDILRRIREGVAAEKMKDENIMKNQDTLGDQTQEQTRAPLRAAGTLGLGGVRAPTEATALSMPTADPFENLNLVAQLAGALVSLDSSVTSLRAELKAGFASIAERLSALPQIHTELTNISAGVELLSSPTERAATNTDELARVTTAIDRAVETFGPRLHTALDMLGDRLEGLIRPEPTNVISINRGEVLPAAPEAMEATFEAVEASASADELTDAFYGVSEEPDGTELVTLEESTETVAPPTETAGWENWDLSDIRYTARTTVPAATAGRGFSVGRDGFSISSYSRQKQPGKYNTIVRVGRTFWDLAEFGEGDRFRVTRGLRGDRDAITIEVASDGDGIGIMRFGEKTAVLQSTSLGDHNSWRGREVELVASPGRVVAALL